MNNDRQAHPTVIEAALAKHLSRGNIRINTSFGYFSIEAENNAIERAPDGVPLFTSQIQITMGPTFMIGALDDRMLRIVADQLYRWLDLPPPAVRVDYAPIAAAVKVRRKAQTK